MGYARVAEMLRDAVAKPLLEHGRHLALSFEGAGCAKEAGSSRLRRMVPRVL